ncbi:MAG: hypothetical protein AAB864_00380 [Patescibacteria group bacterium]
MQQAAKAAFARELEKQVRWFSEDCWPSNLEFRFPKINEVIEGARFFELTAIDPLTEKEIKEWVAILKPMRALDMKKEARETLISLLEKKGLEKMVLSSVVTDETPS